MKKYDVFISHTWNYGEHYNKVEDWLDEAQSEYFLKWDNCSIPLQDTALNPNSSLNKNIFEEKLDKQIARASIVLILSGMYFTHPHWIEYEVLKAANYGKYIIGIKPWGQEYIPQVVLDNANVIVEWDKSSVINALP